MSFVFKGNILGFYLSVIYLLPVMINEWDEDLHADRKKNIFFYHNGSYKSS